jgi:pimeloyl-ACP methyl ester carboxylesterase
MRQIINLNRLALCLTFNILIMVSQACGKEADSADITDYAKSEHWLALPVGPVKPVDIFYLYPTSWQKKDANEPNICEIDNASMLAGSRLAFDKQATAFESVGNIYAPYYRQADGRYTLGLPENERWAFMKGAPAKDVTAALEYYIEHYNNNRPFILVSHSQGSSVMLVLLSAYMKEHPEVYKRMVAAYVTGYPVTVEFMAANPHLKFAEGPDDTGVIISFNTQSPNVLPGINLVLANNVGLVINPITWTRDETQATVEQSLGSYLPDANRKYVKVPHFADARVDKARGVLICSSVDEDAFITAPFVKGVYHTFDFSFYYFNLMENAGRRANIFLSK